ncbi:MAG TPA: hypothetical protein VGR61_04130 [Candidatus Dormibacteraeota bacterium]|nr:hypothetical protein [Candidatus Dormibacteraeota bacterium]
MALRSNLSLYAAAALTVAALTAMIPASASASEKLAPGAAGADISWPQCGGGYPAGYSFGIVGVTGGHPFSGNDCFASEFDWAWSTGSPQVYVNLDYGVRRDGPLKCASDDEGCQAYNYGYDSAQWAYGYADSQSGGASSRLSNWWLDVETNNVWSESGDRNSYVIQGALDFLQRTAGKNAGVYSTSYQWGLIAGSYAPPGTPNWVAGANGLDDTGKCSAGFWPGAHVTAIQYLNWDLDLDQNRAC